MTRGASFLFPGQLAEYPGMGRDLDEADPAARELFDRTSDRCGLDLRRLVFEGPEAALHENLPAQAGVFLVSTLAARALEREGVAPEATAGYSLGNYAALVAAGGSPTRRLWTFSSRSGRDRAARDPRSDGRRHRRAPGSGRGSRAGLRERGTRSGSAT